jgi:DNA-binding XRE family transcriptional regulator
MPAAGFAFSGMTGPGRLYIVCDMADDLPVLPGFRDMALRRRDWLRELAARRRSAGLSQADVARRMGTSQPAIARLEAGAVDARLSTLERYAAAVGLRLEVRLRADAQPVHRHRRADRPRSERDGHATRP